MIWLIVGYMAGYFLNGYLNFGLVEMVLLGLALILASKVVEEAKKIIENIVVKRYLDLQDKALLYNLKVEALSLDDDDVLVPTLYLITNKRGTIDKEFKELKDAENFIDEIRLKEEVLKK